MAREHLLNYALNRWGLNKKNKVGPVAAWIRECSPSSREEWKECYLKKLAEFLKSQGIDDAPESYLNSLGERLFVKTSSSAFK